MENMENNVNPGEEQEEEILSTPAEAETVPAETASSEEAAPVEEAANEESPVQEEPPVEMKKGLSGTSAVALAAAAVILLAAIVAVLVMNGKKQDDSLSAGETAATTETTEATIPADGNADDVTCKGSYTGSDEAVKAAADTVVATAGDHTLTLGQLQVHYWLTVQNFLSQYGSYAAYFGLDATQPLDTQTCAMADGLT